jgi:hypothetical protein
MSVEPAVGESVSTNGHEVPAEGDSAAAFSELSRLLFGADRQEMQKIQQRLDDPKLHARDVSQTLADAFALRPYPDPKLAEAMGPTLADAFKSSVKKDPQVLVDAISPVMGPAIRKSISDALERMVQSLNQTLEYSLSSKSFKWRWEAFRTGKSFAEVVLLHTLQFRVEQVFLIHRETGLLLQHVSASAGATQDVDMVSGMLTAIQDFVRDSFGGKDGAALDQACVGELAIWIEQTSSIILAAVIRGNAPQQLRSTLKETAEKIQIELIGALDGFQGDAAPFEASRPMLEGCLLHAARDDEKPADPKKRSKTPTVVGTLVMGGLLAAFGVWMFFTIRSRHRWSAYCDRLSAEPGIVVTESGNRQGRWYVRGLRDPLAIDPNQLAMQCQVDSNSLSTRWEPYDSFEPKFALARAVAALHPPATVALAVKDRTLIATGTAQGQWINDARRIAPLLPGIVKFDGQNLTQQDRAEIVLPAALRILTPPPGVVLTFNDGILSVAGTASHNWAASVKTRALTVPGIKSCDQTHLIDADVRSWNFETDRLESMTINFAESDIRILPGQDRILAEAADAARKLAKLAAVNNSEFHVTVLGHGQSGDNPSDLAWQRAQRIVGDLTAMDAPLSDIVADSVVDPGDECVSFKVVADGPFPGSGANR